MKIECIFLRKNRVISIQYVDPSKTYFKWNDGIYIIRNHAINILKNSNQIKPRPQLIFIEGDPYPISLIAGDDRQEFLDQIVLENALRNTSEPRGIILDIVQEYLRSPPKLIMLGFGVMIAIAILSGVIRF